jgi:hypothetical protein
MLLRFVLVAIAVICVSLSAVPGQASTFYVSGTAPGTNVNCSVSAPCATISAAVSVATVGDNIVCQSPPAPSSVTINKSLVIDCSSARATFSGGGAVTLPDSSTVRILINIPQSANDPMRTVRLRGLTLDGATETTNSNTTGFGFDRGIDIQAAATVYIEDCVVSNFRKQGIYDHRTGGQSKLFIKDTTLGGNGGAGIVSASAATAIAVLDNVSSHNNAYGIAVANGNRVAINRSVFSGNSIAGVLGDSGSQIIVNDSTISQNGYGVQSTSSVRVSNSEISFNNAAFSGSAGTFGNNRLSGNGGLGTTPVPLGGATSDLGQQ